jgi:hypothetical protein
VLAGNAIYDMIAFAVDMFVLKFIDAITDAIM